jgi:hypothetical protein
MSDDPIIWRVNRKPRFPVLSLGEYMATEDGPRQTMRRNMKYERIAPTLIYRKLQKASRLIFPAQYETGASWIGVGTIWKRNARMQRTPRLVTMRNMPCVHWKRLSAA